MNKEIYKYDKNNNKIYSKNSYGAEQWIEYDENNNETHWRHSIGCEYWQEYDKNNNLIHFKDSDGNESWYKYNDSGEQKNITEQTLKYIEYNRKIREYNSRTKCSRFEIMDI